MVKLLTSWSVEGQRTNQGLHWLFSNSLGQTMQVGGFTRSVNGTTKCLSHIRGLVPLSTENGYKLTLNNSYTI